MTTTITSADSADTETDFVRDWQTWHSEHEARLADPHGFLAVTSLNWLTAEPQRFPDAPGRWHTDGDGVHVEVTEEEALLVDDAPVVSRHDFGVIPEREGVSLRWGDAVIEVAKRGGFDIVRPRHPDAPLVTAYRGTPSYPPDPRWVVTARYVAFDQPRPTTVGAAVEGLQHVYDAPGRLEFELDGQPLTLTAFGDPATGLTVLFTDRTSGVTTYRANRGLHLPPPAADGAIVIDFNRATNLPCAYTDLATCPLPPAENRLDLPVEAGEKIPFERQSHE